MGHGCRESGFANIEIQISEWNCQSFYSVKVPDLRFAITQPSWMSWWSSSCCILSTSSSAPQMACLHFAPFLQCFQICCLWSVGQSWKDRCVAVISRWRLKRSSIWRNAWLRAVFEHCFQTTSYVHTLSECTRRSIWCWPNGRILLPLLKERNMTCLFLDCDLLCIQKGIGASRLLMYQLKLPSWSSALLEQQAPPDRSENW